MNKSEEIMSMLKEINNLLEKGLKSYYADKELTVPQLAVVTLLGKHEQLKITDISKELKVSPAAVSKIIDRLEITGLVERHRSLKDKRKVFVKLSENFKSTHQNLEQNTSGYLHLLLREEPIEKVEKISKSLNELQLILKDGDRLLSEHILKHSQTKRKE